MKIAILTHNILVDKQLSQILQNLNYETFCSYSLLESIKNREPIEPLLLSFPLIIISDSVSNIEALKIVESLRDQPNIIIRELDCPISDKDNTLTDYFDGIIQKSSSFDSLRDQFAEWEEKVDHGFKYVTDNLLSDPKRLTTEVCLSKTEMRVFQTLRNQPEQVISRDALSKALWNEVNNSHLSQLSNLISKINRKIPTDNPIIETIWGKGYVFHSNKDCFV